MRLIGSALGLVLVMLNVSNVAATTITYTVTGTVSQASPDIAAQFPVGQAASYSFVVETTTPDSDPNPANGVYVNAIVFSKGSIGTYDFTTANGNLNISNGPSSDSLTTFALATGAAVGSDLLKFAVVGLVSNSGVALVNDSIPTSLNLADFDGLAKINPQFLRPNGTFAEVIIPIETLSILGSDTPDGGPVNGPAPVPTPSEVPLPGALSLFLTALCALGTLGRRRRWKLAA
jgi:hypothetical protein